MNFTAVHYCVEVVSSWFYKVVITYLMITCFYLMITYYYKFSCTSTFIGYIRKNFVLIWTIEAEDFHELNFLVSQSVSQVTQ